MIHVIQDSGGRMSAATKVLVTQQFGAEHVIDVFGDTVLEHNDLYRFLIEVNGHFAGVGVSDLCSSALALPQVWENEAGRKSALSDLRQETMARIPSLHWLADGRTPWDVFRDERMMGSSRMDPCSKWLKRKLIDAWRSQRFTPDTSRFYVGIAAHERKRLDGHWTTINNALVRVPGLRERMLPWVFLSPLAETEGFGPAEVDALLAGLGIRRPQLYDDGFSNNNCGGACVKAGHAAWARLLRVCRALYLWWEENEQDFIAWIKNPRASILRDRRGGKTTPLTLRDFRLRIERGDDLTALLLASDHGCGGSCALPV